MSQRSTIIPEFTVFNFNTSLHFYTQLARFDILYSRPEEQFAMLSTGGGQLMIEGLNGSRGHWYTGIMERPLGRGMHLQIQVPDVHSLYQHFIRAAYPIFLELEDKWYRVNDTEVGHTQFLVQDPDGYLLRFFQDIGTRPFVATA